MKKLIALIFLILISTTVLSVSNGYWLRGKDFTTFIEGEQVNFMATTPPNVSSSGTIFSTNEDQILGKWYSIIFKDGLLIHSGITLWSNGLVGGQGALLWELYGFNPINLESELIAKGEITENKEQSTITLDETYELELGNRLKIILKYEKNGTLILDEGDLLDNSEWTSPTGEFFRAQGIENTAILYINQCTFAEIACTDNLSCDDGNPFTQETCNNGNTCGATCSYEACTPSCTTGLECTDDNPLTQDICEGSGTCGATCNNILCEPECNSSADCNDGNANTRDVCNYTGSCFAQCENIELKNTEVTENFCKRRECVGTECSEVVVNYCCGNGMCEQNEQCANDCQNNNLEFVKPEFGDYVNLGETLSLVVKAPKGTKLTATGFFGNLKMFDDGKHEDGLFNDGVFGTQILIEEGDGIETIAIQSTVGEKIFYHINVVPLLEVFLELDKKTKTLTDFLEIKGNVARKSIPVIGTITLRAKNDGKTIFQEEKQLDEFGNFKHSYKSLSTDPTGEWVISVSGNDEFGNKIQNFEIVKFLNPEETLPLQITVLDEIQGSYRRNDFLGLDVLIESEDGLVEGAIVDAILSGGKKARLTGGRDGIYSLNTQIPVNISSGEIKIVIIAEKNGLNGRIILETSIKGEEIIVKKFQPTGTVFSAGDVILFTFVLNYENGVVVENAKTRLTINGEEVTLTEDGDFYTAEYLVMEEGELEVRLEATDATGNTGSTSLNFRVQGFGPSYYFSLYSEIIIGAIIGIILIVGGIYYFYTKSTKASRLIKKEQELTRKIQGVQTRYFKQGSLSRQKYDELMLKYEQELESVKKKK